MKRCLQSARQKSITARELAVDVNFPDYLSSPLSPSLKIISKQPSAVLVVMAIGTEVLPVGAVRRIVLVVAVFMMHCEEAPVFEIELPPAFSAYQAVDFQGLLPVIGDRGIALF